jgi:hypothetical protein
MIIVYQEQNSDLQKLFRKQNESLTPYLDKTIGEVSHSLWSHLGVTEFWYPAGWNVKGQQAYNSIEDIRLPNNETIIWTSVFVLPHAIDNSQIQQNSEECFSFENSSVLITHGASSFVDLVKKPRVSNKGVLDYEFITKGNFLSSMLEVLPDYNRLESNQSVVISGQPYINSDNVINSKVYGPCYISEDCTVIDSVIYPGSIVISSSLNKVSVEEGYIYSSNIDNSKVESSLVVESRVSNMVLLNSTVPANSSLGSK